MLKRLLLALLFCGAALGVLALAKQQGTPGQRFFVQPGGGLLFQQHLTFLGSFRLPAGTYGALPDTSTFAAGWVGGMVYNDPMNGKSIFIKGDKAFNQVSDLASMAQITIPALLDPNSGCPTSCLGISGLNTGTHVQGFDDASGGQSATIMLSAPGLGTSVVYNNKLIGMEFIGYDANCQQTKLAWVGNITFGSQTGPYAFPAMPVTPRMAGKYLTVIPQAFRAALGGSLIGGANGGSIVSCGANGPGLFAFDGDTLATQPSSATSITAVPLAYWDLNHANLGAWNSNDSAQTCTSPPMSWPNGGGTCTFSGPVPSITFTHSHPGLAHVADTNTLPYEDNAGPVAKSAGILFADNTRSVLVFGAKAIGIAPGMRYNYKPCTISTWPVPGGTCEGAPCFISDHAGDPYVYDPDLPNCTATGGDFAWPTTPFVWAFDVNDLKAVKAGTKNPWDVVPYTGWSFSTYGDGDGDNRGCGAAWDPSTRIVYLVCELEDGNQPLVHAYRVATPP